MRDSRCIQDTNRPGRILNMHARVSAGARVFVCLWVCLSERKFVINYKFDCFYRIYMYFSFTTSFVSWVTLLLKLWVLFMHSISLCAPLPFSPFLKNWYKCFAFYCLSVCGCVFSVGLHFYTKKQEAPAIFKSLQREPNSFLVINVICAPRKT